MKKQHNNSMAHSAKPHKKRPFRLLALMAMMALAPALWAQDPVYPNYDPAYVNGRPEWNGTTASGDFKISGNVDVGSVEIDNGKILRLFPVGPNAKITKVSRSKEMFKLTGTGQLYIIGNETNTLKIYGNSGNENGPIPTHDTHQGAAILCEYGTPQVWLKYVEFYGFVTNTEMAGNYYNDNQGGIVTMGSHSYTDANGVCNMDHVTFRDSFGGPVLTNSNTGFGRIISLVDASWTVTLDYVTIHDCIISEKLHGDYYSIGGMGSAIRSQGNVGGSLTMRNCVAYNNTYRDLSAKYGNITRYTMEEVMAQPLSGQGGVVNWRSGRKTDDGDARVEILDCKFHHNSARCGGAVATCANIKMDRTKIYENKAEQGGGVYFYTYNGKDKQYDGNGFRAIFGDDVDIYDNSASEYGGGAYLTFDASNDVGFTAGNVPMSPEFSLNINAGSAIRHNKAPKGAGIALVDGCPYSHYYSDISKWSLEYQRTVNLNGGKVYDNYAQGTVSTVNDTVAGAGIYIEKYEYSSSHLLSGFHTDYTNNPDPLAHNNSGTLTVNLASGEVYNNSAVNGTKPGFGGGVYIASKFETNSIKSTLNVNIGEVGKDLQMYNNQAYTDGGGVYVRYDRTNDRKNEGTVTVNGGTIGRKKPVTDEIEGNKALTRNGGGICVMGGTVEVKGGKIEYNTAGTDGGGLYVSVPNNESITTIQGAASISHNTANNGNGGGVCLDKGRINIYGSDISNNKATIGNGGGLYIQEGDILVWPNEMLVHPNAPVFGQCEATKTTVLNNTAGGNGGGLNTHVGRFDVRFAQIKNNTAGYNYSSVGTNGGNGGGLFCNGTEHDNGYTVRLLHCDLEENKAFGNVYEGAGITGRGGGVYLKIGSIFAEHCDIIKNEADINGGGLDNHSGELRVFGTYIDENVAKTGRGGGLYTEEGNIVVGPCDTYGYIDSKASRIIKNKAKLNGGGINNHHGDITIYGDRINENVAETGDGGGVYIKSGNIKMYGGQINNNKADKGKGGGVYGGSGTFNIMERKANPIMEIMEVEDIEATRFIVHFHHVDRGNAMKAGSTDKEFGIAYSKNPYPDINEDEEWTDANWSGVTKIRIKVANGTSDTITTYYPDSLYTYVRTEGCSRVIIRDSDITSVDANTEYYVVAYGKYTFGGKNYFEASPALKIKTASGSKTSQGPRSVYPAVEENPFFQELTPLQQAIMASTPEGDTTAARATNNGTHRDDPDPAPPVDIPEINYNTAVYGGGICIDLEGASLIFAGSREADPDTLGQINYNYASEAGGGIYIGRESADKYAQMQMMGKCEVNYNRVPAFKLGGGIYLDGRLYVGDSPNDDKNVHGLKVDKNFAITKDSTNFVNNMTAIANGSASDALVKEYEKALNNVFLPRSEYDYDEHATSAGDNSVSVITLLSDISGYQDMNSNDLYDQGIDHPYSHIGFSVLKGFCPVIATSNEFKGTYDVFTPTPNTNCDPNSEVWLFNLMTMAGVQNDGTAESLQGAVFEDSESYVAVHTRFDMAPFREKYIYLWGCWTHPIVRYDPESENPMSKKYGYEEAGSEEHFLGHYKIKNPGDYTTDEEENNGISTGETALEWEIYSPEGLAWFTCYVNGLNVFDESDKHTQDPSDPDGEYHFIWSADQNPKANAVIMNDLDMSAYLWVPIGSVQKFYVTALTDDTQGSLFVDSETAVTGVDAGSYTKDAHYYSGTFDGQGHIIKGLQGLYLTGIEKFGLFGYLDGATVKNTFVDDGLFVSDNVEVIYSAGGIAGEMKSGSISNSEARSNMNVTHCNFGTKVGGLVGDMLSGSIHSSMAMPTILGQNKGMSGETPAFKAFQGYMGGLVGKMDQGTSVKNSYANVEMNLIDTDGATVAAAANSRYIGGIVGYNNQGLVENVYVRYNNETNTPDLPNNLFYWIAGYNNNKNTDLKYCFTPNGKTGQGQWLYTTPTAASLRRTYTATDLMDDKYGFAHSDQEVATFGGDANTYLPTTTGLSYDKNTHETSFNGLVDALNNWVAAQTDGIAYSKWTRTMASTINDDYPVPMFDDFNVVGTEDGIYMKYDDNVNDMWKKPNYDSLAIADRTGKNFQGLTAALNPKAAMYLYKTNPTAISVTENTAVPLHIHQNVGVLQEEGKNLTVRVGVTFDNSDGTIANGGAPYDWHMFSSALKAAPLGITYQSSVTDADLGGKTYEIYINRTGLSNTGITHTNYGNRDYMDPPVITWRTDSIGYFPTNTPYGKWGGNGHWPSSGPFSGNSPDDYNSFDFYCLDEPSRHWINFKREGSADFMDHWHQDIDASGNHKNLKYMNEGTLRVGKGYMMGVSKTSMLMADGILNNGTFQSGQAVTNTPYNFNMSGYSEELRGFNLVGNPYQSYLNFDELIRENVGNIIGDAYYLFDADAGRYICYPADASPNPINAPQFIHPHQGFLVKTEYESCMLTFNNAMRAAEPGTGSHFRSERLNYPLVNLFCHDAAGFYDVTTVEMNRPQLGGGVKLKETRNGNSLIYARLENEDYQTLFAPTGTSTVPVRFEPSQNGVYTLRWDTMHGDFSHLHLIDNLTGADIDLLNQTEYRFEGKVSDYVSRFKLVFEVTDIEEHEQESETNFAFQFGDELVVNGVGELSVFDVQGRHIMTRSLTGAQSSISLPRTAAGLYILRLAGDKQVKIQKLIIK